MVQWLQGGVTKNIQHSSVFRGWQCTSEHKTNTENEEQNKETLNWQVIVIDTTTVWRVETAVRAEVYHWYG